MNLFLKACCEATVPTTHPPCLHLKIPTGSCTKSLMEVFFLYETHHLMYLFYVYCQKLYLFTLHQEIFQLCCCRWKQHCYLYISPPFLLWLLCAPSYSAGRSKTDLTSPNCMAMKPYHSVQISIPLLGEILFQAITLHQGAVIPTLLSYCPPWPVSPALPLRQPHAWCTSCRTPVMQPLRTLVQSSKYLNGACMEISSLFFRVKSIKHHSLDEMLIRRNGVAYKVLIKCHESLWDCDLPDCLLNARRFCVTGRAPMIHACSPFIFAACSVYEKPQITAPVDPCCSNPQQNCEGLYGEPCQLPWGANDLSNLPLLTPVVVRQWEKICLCLLLLPPPTGGTEDESYLSILIPGAGRPCLFILIGSICGTAVAWRRLALAVVCSRFPLATVQLAGKTASSTHSANQYKQWSSKSRIMSERTETGGRIKLLMICCSEIILFWELVKMCFRND